MKISVKHRLLRATAASFCCLAVTAPLFPADAGTRNRTGAVVTIATPYDFQTLVSRLEVAVTKNDMLVVAKASASAGAQMRGLTIPGDAVIMVFRNDFAVRMLAAKPEAGLEAPIPIHVFEAADGRARISYRTPTALFHPYRITALDSLAHELDPIFQRIVTEAATK